MEGCRIYDDSLWCSNSSSSSFYGTVSTVKLEDIERENKRDDERPLFMADSTDLDSKVENELEHTEKKRRLTSDQVQFLEKSFELENKLEPDRKIQLAKHVGLQPRQVAIWFQNRRARFKTKMLEKEYSSLKSSYDKLKADYDALYSDNDKLKNEVDMLRKRLKVRGDKVKREACDPISPLDFEPKNNTSDCTDGNHSSDLSQEEDYDSFIKKSCFPKLEDECYDDLQPNSCNLGFPVQDQGTWFWQY